MDNGHPFFKKSGLFAGVTGGQRSSCGGAVNKKYQDFVGRTRELLLHHKDSMLSTKCFQILPKALSSSNDNFCGLRFIGHQHQKKYHFPMISML